MIIDSIVISWNPTQEQYLTTVLKGTLKFYYTDTIEDSFDKIREMVKDNDTKPKSRNSN